MHAFTSSLRASARRAPLASARSIPRASFRSSFRKYTTEAPAPKSSNTALYASIGLALVGGVGYYAYTSSDTPATIAKSGAQATKAALNFTPTKADYQKVYNKIAQKIDDAGDYDDGSFGPLLLRLAWHSSGTYDKDSKTGGSSNYATMRFEPEALHGANNGLHIARGIMEELKKEFDWISYGDLWTLAGVAAVQEMGGPKIPWRPGRIDGVAKDATPDGRLPNGALGQDHLRVIFGRMGFNDQEIVALSGAHALGRCHADRSGFEGPWTFSPTTVSNDFFKLLLSEKWVWRKWGGPKQYADKKTGSLMMLPTDYALVQDKVFKKHVEAYAADEQLFFKDFAAVIAKLFELGVPSSQWAAAEPWTMQSTNDQE
ncbi:cytochrome c peroxidase [Gloeopeniophorella convolvens]|nr:cytochrome c peroxidase [Gloeopeniophorella convolvens]